MVDDWHQHLADATVRLLTRVTKGPSSRGAGVVAAIKLIESALFPAFRPPGMARGSREL
jgi:hypothetical protein